MLSQFISVLMVLCAFVGESIPIRLFLAGYELTPTMRDINKKFSVRYYLNLVLIDEEERRYFKQQVRNRAVSSWTCRLLLGILGIFWESGIPMGDNHVLD